MNPNVHSTPQTRSLVECAMCGIDSIVQQNWASNYVHKSNTEDYISCINCNKFKFCSGCISALHQQVVVDGGTKYDSNDCSYQALISMNKIITNTKTQHNTIQFGFCCSFKASISSELSTKRSTSKPPFAISVDIDSDGNSRSSSRISNDNDIVSNNTYTSNHDDVSDDDVYKAEQTNSRDVSISILRRKIMRLEGSPTLCNRLEEYHTDPTTFTCRGKLKRIRPSDIVHEINNKRRKHTRPRAIIHHNHYEGLLMIHMWAIGIQSDTCDVLTADHMALSKSLVDKTPAAMHCVTSKRSADEAYELDCSRKTLKGCENRKFKLKVPSPEDLSKYRDLVVHVIWVEQMFTYEECNQKFAKGENNFSSEHLNELKTFSNDDIDDDVDYTVLMGLFSKEQCLLPPKLLLIRPTNMMTNISYNRDERNHLAEIIYKALRPYAGKRGYEMRRLCGSSGLVSPTSDKDLLAVLHEHRGLLPRKVGGVFVIRSNDKYVFLYRRVTSSGPLFGSNYYSPPQDGGALNMPDICTANIFPLADQAYNKMLAIVMMNELNQKLQKDGCMPAATGPVGCEMLKINKAREVYSTSDVGEKMYNMICAINKMNNFSMVGYGVGNHEDHYYGIDSEYIENKSTWAIGKEKTIGRGGSILPNKYVFAILDWGKSKKKA